MLQFLASVMVYYFRISNMQCVAVFSYVQFQYHDSGLTGRTLLLA